MGIAQNAIKPFVSTAAKSVTVKAVNTATGATASTVVQSIGGLTVGAAGGTLAYLSAEKVKRLQEKGIANYCANNLASCSDFLFIHQVMSGGELSSYEILEDGHRIRVELVRSDGTKLIRETTSNSAYKFTHVENHPFGGRVMVYVHPADIFDSLSEGNRVEIINALPISELVQAVEVIDLNLPEIQPGEEIITDTDLVINDGVVEENQEKNNIPSELEPEPNPTPEPEPTPNPEPSPEPEPTPSEENLTTSEIPELPPVEFNQKNWLEHGIEVFSQKFPFDIFGEVSIEGGYVCPTYIFFEMPFELCPIADVIAILKYPAIIGFAIRMYHSL